MERYEFDVKGMSCAACQARVEKAVNAIDGVEKCNVNLLSNSMSVELPNEEMVSTVIQSVQKAGYDAMIRGGDAAAGSEMKVVDQSKELYKSMKKRFFTSLALLIPLMCVSMGHMLPFHTFLHDWFRIPDHAVRYAFTQFIILLPIMYINRAFFINGFKALWRRSPNMDSLIAVGATASIIHGVVSIFILGEASFTGDMATLHKFGHNLYFEGAGMILTLITMGKMLETRAKGKTTEAIAMLAANAPKTAVILKDGKEVTVDVDKISVGDIMVIKPGSGVGADGKIVEGMLSLDQAAITGESIPVDKVVGDEVISGSVNVDGFAKVEATKVGKESTIQQVIKLVEEASSSKAPISRIADKIAGIFVPVVMSISLLTFIIWIIASGDISNALSFAIAVLVVSCPCALGLATPVAIMVGTGKGAKNGILFKSGEAIETLGKVNVICMDKTGTLTKGRPSVVDFIEYDRSISNLAYAASIEKQSEHPLAKAVTEHFDGSFVDVDDYRTVIGRGAQGIIDGKEVLIGSMKYMNEAGVDSKCAEADVERLSDEGKTILLLSVGGKVTALFAVQDVEKESAADTIRELEKLNIRTIMLTGDNNSVARNMQKRLGFSEFRSDLLPQDKEKIIRELQEQGKVVAMVGDGINDAPSLMRADVGIGVSSGTDIANESADVIISKPSLMAIRDAVALSRKVMLNIKENLFWAFFYNSLGIPLAAGAFYAVLGWQLNPMFAAAAMSLSSFTVVSNALRLNFFHGIDFDRSVDEGTHAVKKSEDDKKENKENNTNEETEMFGLGGTKYVLKIEGMMCMHCVKHVEDALNAVDGVKSVKVSLEDKEAKVSGKEGLDAQLKAAVEGAGYKVL